VRRLAPIAIALALAISACGGTPTAAHAPPPVPIAAPGAPAASAAASSAPAAATAQPIAPGRGPHVASLPGSAIRFTGGDGSSQQAAIKVVGAKGESDGVAAEYRYLDLVYGPRDRGAWQSLGQSLLEDHGRQLDALEIKRADGRTETVYFDITDYFGKF